MNATRAGPCVVIRELRDSQRKACEVFVGHLDPKDIRQRFAAPQPSIAHLLPRPSGTGRSIAFAALGTAEDILGVLNIEYLNRDAIEVAVVVRSDHQRRGIGRALMEHALRWAKDHGISQVVGHVLRENIAMLRLARAMGFRSTHWEPILIELERHIGHQAA